jgi:hypothetical protein
MVGPGAGLGHQIYLQPLAKKSAAGLSGQRRGASAWMAWMAWMAMTGLERQATALEPPTQHISSLFGLMSIYQLAL